jgi:hypothetical protein
VFLLIAMTSSLRQRKPLVRLMELKADAMGLSAWPLSHSVIDSAPHRSWPEVLGCSSHEFSAELKTVGTMATKLSTEGVHVTATTIWHKSKKLKFSTVGAPLGDSHFVDDFVNGDLPVRFTDYLDSMMDEGTLYYYSPAQEAG